MNYAEYKTAHAALTVRQHRWLMHKARWEHMTPWAVMNEWTVPKHEELDDDGTWRTPTTTGRRG